MASVPKNWRIGRFSDGQEQLPESERRMRIGRFSDGQEQLPESERRMRIGRFSDGQEQHGMIAVSGRFGAPSPERRAAA
jgi:hypothetical protein